MFALFCISNTLQPRQRIGKKKKEEENGMLLPFLIYNECDDRYGYAEHDGYED